MTVAPDPARPPEDAELDDWLGAPVPTEATEAGEEERIVAPPDADYADRLLWRARKLAGERQGVEDFFRRRIEEITAWRERRVRAIGHEQRRVRESLELFTRRALAPRPEAKGKPRKSIPLTNGTLKLVAPGRGRVEVTDEHALTTFCEAHGLTHLLRYKPEANKTAIGEIENLTPRPQDRIEGPDGQPEMWNTWAYLVSVPTDNEATGLDTLTEAVTLPGVRYMERADDRFGIKLADEAGEEEEL